MSEIVTMGEIMLRLSPEGYNRFGQANDFQAHYGGAEANVAVSLANFGHEVSYVTKLPDNDIADSAINMLKANGVDCSHIVRGGSRIGIYFLENGVSVRPSRVIYDRANSSMSMAETADFDFDKIFEGAKLFHVSGITPVLSDSCAELTLEAVKAAKRHNVLVSFDLNYRAKLWTDNVLKKQHVMADLLRYTDVCFGNAFDIARCTGYEDEAVDYRDTDFSKYVEKDLMCRLVKKFNFLYMAASIRNNISASENILSGVVCDGNKLCAGRKIALNIVDRVGSGDAFAAGFLHSVCVNDTLQKAIDTAVASAAIKHTVPGDVNKTNIFEIEALTSGNVEGRVDR